MVVVLAGTLQGLSHDALYHFLVAFDLELSIHDARHILLHLFLSLHHQLLALNWVHPSDLEVVIFVLFHASLERGEVVVDHEAVDWELFFGLQLENRSTAKSRVIPRISLSIMCNKIFTSFIWFIIIRFCSDR